MKYLNGKGDSVTTELSRAQLAAAFAEDTDDTHWMWYHIAKRVESRRSRSNTFLADSFLFAIGMGLKRPKIRLYLGDQRYKLYLSRRGTVCVKTGRCDSTGKPRGDEEYLGCLNEGSFLASDRRTPTDNDRAFVLLITHTPDHFLVHSSKSIGRCCYCDSSLEDLRSQTVGYGPVCARRWGLPWGTEEKMQSFAELWKNSLPDDRRSVRALCSALRADLTDAVGWEALSDVLEEAGHTKRLSPPEAGTVMPRS